MILPTAYKIKPPVSAKPNKNILKKLGCVGLWSMNEGSGNKVFDLSGNGNDGILTNGPLWKSGRFGSALYFDGMSNQYISIPSAILNTTIGFSVSFWAQKTGGEGNYGIIGNPDTSSFSRIIFLDGGNLYLETDTNADAAQGTPSHDTLLHHYVITGVGGVIAMYEDGVALTMSDSFVTDNLTYDRIAINQLSFDFLGILDNVILYKRALSASEIALLYREPFWMFASPAEVALLGGYTVAGAGSPLLQMNHFAGGMAA